MILKQKHIVSELHAAIKSLYASGVIPNLHSCLDELIWTSILRFEQMGLIEVNSYGNKQGSKTTFLVGNPEKK
jgi:hypothetical protein